MEILDAVGNVASPESLTMEAKLPLKQRERWSDKEHETFVHALKSHGRRWQLIAEQVKTKSAVQIRSHAQKFFTRVEKQRAAAASGECTEEDSLLTGLTIPPPRPKRKPHTSRAQSRKPTEASGDNGAVMQATYSTFDGAGPSGLSMTVPEYEAFARAQSTCTTDVRSSAAAVAAAASAAAAAAAAAVVLAAGNDVQMQLQHCPPPGFPFFGMPPSMLLNLHNPINVRAMKACIAKSAGPAQGHASERTGTNLPGIVLDPVARMQGDDSASASSREKSNDKGAGPMWNGQFAMGPGMPPYGMPMPGPGMDPSFMQPWAGMPWGQPGPHVIHPMMNTPGWAPTGMHSGYGPMGMAFRMPGSSSHGGPLVGGNASGGASGGVGAMGSGTDTVQDVGSDGDGDAGEGEGSGSAPNGSGDGSNGGGSSGNGSGTQGNLDGKSGVQPALHQGAAFHTQHAHSRKPAAEPAAAPSPFVRGNQKALAQQRPPRPTQHVKSSADTLPSAIDYAVGMAIPLMPGHPAGQGYPLRTANMPPAFGWGPAPGWSPMPAPHPMAAPHMAMAMPGAFPPPAHMSVMGPPPQRADAAAPRPRPASAALAEALMTLGEAEGVLPSVSGPPSLSNQTQFEQGAFSNSTMAPGSTVGFRPFQQSGSQCDLAPDSHPAPVSHKRRMSMASPAGTSRKKPALPQASALH